MCLLSVKERHSFRNDTVNTNDTVSELNINDTVSENLQLALFYFQLKARSRLLNFPTGRSRLDVDVETSSKSSNANPSIGTLWKSMETWGGSDALISSLCLVFFSKCPTKRLFGYAHSKHLKTRQPL